MLEYCLDFLITEDTVDVESSICIFGNDSCQCRLAFDYFYNWNIVAKVLNLIAFDTVVKYARESQT